MRKKFDLAMWIFGNPIKANLIWIGLVCLIFFMGILIEPSILNIPCFEIFGKICIGK